MDIRILLDDSYRANKRQWLKKLTHGKVTPEMAEDAVQDACIRAMIYSHSYDTGKHFDGWFNTLLRNALMDVLATDRRGGMHVEYKEELDVRDYKETASSGIFLKVSDEINNLPEPRKEICRLYFLCDMKPREIEQVVEASGNSIRGIIKRFKKHLEETYGT